ncbi:MAG: glycosyltransferase family 39 protein [Planctomycetota bacterium]|nr:glycosyltransferase family 39 protein [Planctomycetota bacterium]
MVASSLHKQKARIVATGLFICAMGFCFQGSRGLWAPDEGRYVSGGAAMLDAGDLLVARPSHQPYLNKPPLTFWGIAAGLKLFGWNEWGARAFNAVCFILTAIAVGVLGYCLWGAGEGILAALVYATLAAPVAAASVITPDTPLTLWCAAGLLCFWKSVYSPSHKGPWKVLLGLAIGLGALTKGPAAFIPCVPMFVYLLLTRQTLKFFLTPWLLLAAAVCLAVSGWWYVAVIRSIPGAAEYLWSSQVWGRLVSDEYKRSPGVWNGVLLYGPMLTAGTLPWSLVALIALLRLRKPVHTLRWWRQLRERPAVLLLLLWVAIPSAALVLASSKLPLYILPVFPAIALLVARVCACAAAKNAVVPPLQPTPRLALVAGAWGVGLLALKIGACYWPMDRDMRALWEEMRARMPSGPHCVVAVDKDLGGVAFYSKECVIEATTLERPYPDFVRSWPLDDEIAAARDCELQRVFVTRTLAKELAAAKRQGMAPVCERLRQAGVAFEEVALTRERRMIVCQPGHDRPGVARLAFVYDDGTSAIGASNLADALYRLSREVNVQGIVFLHHAYCPLSRARQEAGWRPYERVLPREIPLYAVAPDGPDCQPAAAIRTPCGHVEVFGGGMLQVCCAETGKAGLDSCEGRDAPGCSYPAGAAGWRGLAVHELPSGEMPAALGSWLAQQRVRFVVSSDYHLCTQAGAGQDYDNHDLLAEAKQASTLASFAPAESANRQLVLLVEASEGACSFRLYNSVRSLLAQWSLDARKP